MSDHGQSNSGNGLQFTDTPLEYWQKRWEIGMTGFHLKDINPSLQKHLDLMIAGRSNIRIFIPLCGKAVDIKWLADMGHEVVGVEGSELSIQAFFREQNVEYTTEPVNSVAGTVYKSSDNKIRIYLCDFFSFSSSVEGKFDAIWDRGALVAVSRGERQRYAEVILELMAPRCICLLSTVDYDYSKFPGPPHYVSEEEIFSLYEAACTVEKVDYADVTEEKHFSWNLSSVHERVHKIARK